MNEHITETESRPVVASAIESQTSDLSQVILSPEKPKTYYIVIGTFLFGTMVVGSAIFMAFLSVRKY